MSVAFQVVPGLGVIPGKILEYMNQTILCDCAKDLSIHEQYIPVACLEKNYVSRLSLFLLWTMSISRLLMLFSMALTPFFGFKVETVQKIFAAASWTCLVTTVFDVLQDKFLKSFDTSVNQD